MLVGDEVHHPVREMLTKELQHGKGALLLMACVHRWPRLPNNRHTGNCTGVGCVAVAKRRRLGLNQDWVIAVARRLMAAAGQGCTCISECPYHVSILSSAANAGVAPDRKLNGVGRAEEDIRRQPPVVVSPAANISRDGESNEVQLGAVGQMVAGRRAGEREH